MPSAASTLPETMSPRLTAFLPRWISIPAPWTPTGRTNAREKPYASILRCQAKPWQALRPAVSSGHLSLSEATMKPLTEPWFRLAYITPHPIVDNVPYQFYRFAPDGVMLMLANLEIAEYSTAAVDRELPLFWKHVEELAHAGADRIVLTGVPVSAALGHERVLALKEEVGKRTGVAFDTD